MADVEWAIYDLTVKSDTGYPVETETHSQFIVDLPRPRLKPTGGFCCLAGPGAEFGHKEGIALIRFGMEYTFLKFDHWKIKPAFSYDWKAMQTINTHYLSYLLIRLDSD